MSSGIPKRPGLKQWPHGIPWNSGTPRTPNTIRAVRKRENKTGKPWGRCAACIAYSEMPRGTPRTPHNQGTDWWACPSIRAGDTPYCVAHQNHVLCELCEQHRPHAADHPDAADLNVCVDCVAEIEGDPDLRAAL